MYISFNWLIEYLDLKKKKLDPEDVALQLSLKGANVEGTEEKDGDFIFDIENKSITHRPDLFCHYGVAREVAAIYGLKLKEIKISKQERGTKSNSKIIINNENSEFCSRYIGVQIDKIKIGDSPAWLRKKLESLGEKSINNIVDLTNFVLFEVGQPMHAFDNSKFVRDNSDLVIGIRKAEEEENLVTLDNRELKLTTDDFVIADGRGGVALAGVKGGKSAEVDQKTDSIILEAANFDGPSVRKISLRQNLRTEASSRFEKRLDPNLCEIAIDRFIELLPKIGCEGYEIISSVDDYPKKRKSWDIDVNLKRLPSFAGVDIPQDKVLEIFQSLELKVVNQKKDSVVLEIPTWRNDLHFEEDIYEEVMRIYGFENIKPKPIHGEVTPAKWPIREEVREMIQDALVSLGYDEIWLHTFTNEKTLKNAGLDIKNHIRVSNALSKEVEFMRTSLVPEMLNKVKFNANNFDKFKIFSLDKILKMGRGGLKDIREESRLSFLIYNKDKDGWKAFDNPVLELKNDLLQSLRFIGKDLGFDEEPKDVPPFLDEWQSLGVLYDKQRIGYVGVIEKGARSRFKINGSLVLADLDLEVVFNKLKEGLPKKVFQPINTFPKIIRDLSFWIEEGYSWVEIKNCIKNLDFKYLKKIELFDTFVEGNKKSLAIRLELQAEDKTLVDKDADDVLDKVQKHLKQNFKIELRNK